MAERPTEPRLVVKKYANRRFYDSTRGRNVSLAELHDLIVAGHEIAVTDATTGEDITNAILTQLILERHAPKLAIFPPAILHQIIRTQSQFLGSVLEQFVRQTLETQQTLQAQWARMWQSALNVSGPTPAPADWMRQWMQAVGAASRPAAAAAEPANGQPSASATAEVNDLRRQIAELLQRVDALQHNGREDAP